MRLPGVVLTSVALVGCGRVAFERTDAPVDAPPPPLIDEPALLAYWPLDEDVGATAFSDDGTDGNHGSCEDCPLAGVAGVRGRAIEITSAAAIRIAPQTRLASLSGTVTVAAWVRREGTTQYGTIVSTDRDCCGTWNGYSLWAQHYGNGPGFLTWAGSGVVTRSDTPLPLGVWAHIVGTYDGTYNRIYVDGVEVSRTASPGIAAPHSYVPYIGSMGYAAPDYHFIGAIDEVLVLDRALDASEVAVFFAAYSDASPSGVRP